MSKFTLSAAAVSLLLASSLAAQTAQQKPAAKQPTAAAQAAPAKATTPAPAAVTQAKPKADTTAKASKSKGTKHADGTTATEDQVKKAQQSLADKGLYKGKVTGRSNAAFRAALKQYQKDNQLKATGRLNQETLAKLGIM
jgi:peptidoglycan hydrolase-like protein with peptidoglycan-binding domain